MNKNNRNSFISKAFNVFPFPYLAAFLIICLSSGIHAESTSLTDKKPKDNPVEISEILSIGIEDPKIKSEEPYRFYSIKNIDCDVSGNLYVMDEKESCIKVFDKYGKFIREILGKGKGPKEVSNAGQFRINDFSNHLFVLQDYGYTIKEFDTSGNYIKTYLLPQQYVFDFEFLDRDRAIFIPRKSPDDPTKYIYKLVNIKSKVIEKIFLETDADDYLRFKQRFIINDNTAWIVTFDQMRLIGFSLRTWRESVNIKIPGNFKKNTYVTKKIHGGHSVNPIIYNSAQPFYIGQKLFVLVCFQDYKLEKNEISQYPSAGKHILYSRKGDILKEVAILKGFEFMELGAVKANRLYFFTNDPYPHIKVAQVK